MLTRPSFLACLATLALTQPALAQDAPRLTERTYAQLRDYVLPDKEEERWRNVDWKSSYWDAVVEAQKAKKPILLWAMNGHPLGHT
ncbi:MAG: hypothetical protein KDD82_29540 [Planctomycetes bacterium]|nr:hypothetical protein [Planctomycetota bacterium]